MNEKEKSDLDQTSAFLTDSLPPMLRRLHVGLVDEGFSKEEAFTLVRDYLSGMLLGGRSEGGR